MPAFKNILNKMKTTGFVHIFMSSFFNKIITFLSSYILIRILSKADYGVYSYAQYVLNLFMIVSGLGIASGLLQIFSENPNDKTLRDSYLRRGTFFALLVNSLISISIFVFALVAGNSFEGLREVLFVMMFIPLFDVQFDLILVYYRGNLDNKKYSYLCVVNSILVAVLSNVGAFLFGAIGLVIFRVLSSVLTILFAIIVLRFPIRDVFKKQDIALNEWKLVLKISIIAVLCNSATIIMQNIDGVLLGELLNDSEAVAAYKVATYIPSGLAFLPQALVIYIYPYFASHIGDKQWVKKTSLRLMLAFGVVNALITVMVWFIAPYIVPLVFGDNYEDAISPLRILMITYFFNATFRNTSGNILASQRKIYVNLWLGLLGIVVNVFGDILLIPRYGLNGAALATMAVVIFVAITSTGYLFFFFKGEKNLFSRHNS